MVLFFSFSVCNLLYIFDSVNLIKKFEQVKAEYEDAKRRFEDVNLYYQKLKDECQRLCIRLALIETDFNRSRTLLLEAECELQRCEISKNFDDLRMKRQLRDNEISRYSKLNNDLRIICSESTAAMCNCEKYKETLNIAKIALESKARIYDNLIKK